MKYNSFEIYDGINRIMFSAPHAVEQLREGQIKGFEPHTGMLVEALVNQGCCGIIKTANDNDDANYDPVNPYKDELKRFIDGKGVRVLFDIHELAPEREMDVCIGTGLGANLCGRGDIVELVKECFLEQGIDRITVDEPFAAAYENTVSAFVARECQIPAIQIELNCSMFFEERDMFDAVLNALGSLANRCEEL